MKPLLAIPLIALLVGRAWSRKSLTPLGLVVAALTASIHAVHPWSAPFVLLAVFYFSGTKVTKVKHDVKARLTLSATGSEAGDTQRTHIQVLANSVVATVLILLHVFVLRRDGQQDMCFSNGGYSGDVFVVGIVANYAAVAADTFSSELGILSKSPPRLITSPTLRVVPPGTNGGVSSTGLLAGVLGAFIVSVTAAGLIPFCGGGIRERANWVIAFTICGTLGSILDSVLGALFQASVVDRRTGKVVEGAGGKKVLLHPAAKPGGSTGIGVPDGHAVDRKHDPPVNTKEASESRRIESGADWLDNNAVNVAMAATISVGAMIVAAKVYGVPPVPF